MTIQEYCCTLINTWLKVNKSILSKEYSSDGKTFRGYRLRIVITKKFLDDFQKYVEPENVFMFPNDPKFYEFLSSACKNVLTSAKGVIFFREHFGIQIKERTTIITCRKNECNNNIIISSNLFKTN